MIKAPLLFSSLYKENISFSKAWFLCSFKHVISLSEKVIDVSVKSAYEGVSIAIDDFELTVDLTRVNSSFTFLVELRTEFEKYVYQFYALEYHGVGDICGIYVNPKRKKELIQLLENGEISIDVGRFLLGVNQIKGLWTFSPYSFEIKIEIPVYYTGEEEIHCVGDFSYNYDKKCIKGQMYKESFSFDSTSTPIFKSGGQNCAIFEKIS